MKTILLILLSGFLFVSSHLASAAATAETAAAAKAKEADEMAQAEAATTASEAATAEEVAAEAAAKAAELAKVAAVAKAAKAKAAVAKAKETAAAAKRAIAEAVKTGAKSCDEWKQERAEKSKDGAAAMWLSGYLSGIEIAKNKDFLSGTNKKTLYAWVDDYCRTNPYEYVSDAAINLYIDLARKKGLID